MKPYDRLTINGDYQIAARLTVICRPRMRTAVALSILFAGAAFAELPDRFVAYVESTNKTTYVDTGIAASPKKTHMTVRLAITAQTSTQSGVFGAATSANGNNAAANISYVSKKFRADWTGGGTDTGITPAVGAIYEIDCHYSDVFIGGKRFYRQGAAEMQKSGSNANTLYLFNYNLSGTPYSNGGVLQRVYACRIYSESIENDSTRTRTLSANLIPCEKDGVAGLWDSVSGTILYPQNFPLVASAEDNAGVKVENGAAFALLTATNDDDNGTLPAAGATWVEVGTTATVAPTANAGLQPEYASTHEGYAYTRTYGGATLSFPMPAWPVEVAVGYVDAAYLPHVSDFTPYIAAASAGDTLLLGPGTYTIAEQIALNKGVTIKGAGRDATVINQQFGTKDRAVNMSNIGAAIRDLTVSGFTNSINGNGIYMTGGTADTVRVTMDYCYHYNSQVGVGIYMKGGTVTNSLIDHNSCHSGYGGCTGLGVCMESSGNTSPTLLVDSEISGNFRKKSETMGIGVRINGGNVNHVLRCRILRNTSYTDTNTGRGGNGIYINGASKAVVEECVIASNGWNGVYMSNGTVRNCLIYGHSNTSSAREAGVRMSGGLLYNNTVTDNSSLTANSGLIMSGGTAANNIIYGNGTAGDLTVSSGTFNTNIIGSASITTSKATGNIPADPRFADAAHCDFSTGFDSPAYNAGATISSVKRDVRGVERPQGGAYDIGAYEYVVDASTLQAAIIVSQSEYGAGATASAAAQVVGGSGSFLYAWYLDGTLLANETGDTITLADVPTGRHTLRLVVTDAADATLTDEYTFADAWTVKPTTVYVGETGSAAWPYDTPATAAASVNDAFDALYQSAATTGTVLIAEGAYRLSAGVNLVAPVHIVGAGRDATVVNGSEIGTAVRAFTLANDAALLKDLTVEGCTNNLDGTAISMSAGRVENVRSTLNCAKSSTTAGKGCGLYMSGGVATNCLFDANRQSTNYGYGEGAGLYISGGLAVDCEITGNTRDGGWGNNSGEVKGVALRAASGGHVVRCRIHDNASTISPANNSYGSGLYASDTAVVENCAIWSNGVQGVFLEGSAKLYNCLVVGHKTTHASYTSGIWLSSGGIYNCTSAGNTATAAEKADLNMTAGTAKNCIAVAASVTGGTSASNFLNEDPHFKAPARGDYRLKSGSPAKNAGNNAAWTGLADSTDLDGNPRIRFGTVDCGCYENALSPTGLFLH